MPADPAPPTRQPPNFLRFTDFLPSDLHQLLLDFVVSRELPLEPGKVSAMHDPSAGAVDATIRRTGVLTTIDEAWPPFEERITTLLPLLLPPPVAVDGVTLRHPIEKTLLRYGDGDFYTLHHDNGGAMGEGRLVTFVYYFHFQPRAFTGGDLWLHDSLIGTDGTAEAAETYTSIEPTDNSIVFFPSDIPHQVRPVRTEREGPEGARFAINGWIHEPR